MTRKRSLEYMSRIQNLYYDAAENVGIRDIAGMIDLTELTESKQYFSLWEIVNFDAVHEKINKQESYFNKTMLIKASAIIEGVLTALNFNVSNNIILGTVLAEELNGTLQRTPYGDFMITINSGIFPLIIRISAIVVKSWQQRTNDEIDGHKEEMTKAFEKIVGNIDNNDILSFKINITPKEIAQKTELVNEFISVYDAYLSNKAVLPFYTVNEFSQLNSFILNFSEASMIFVLAHEYAHLVLNHFEDNREDYELRFRQYNSGNLAAFRISPSQQREIEADQIALNVVVIAFTHYYKTDLNSTLMYALFFLSLLEIIWAANDYSDNQTHWAPLDRIDELLMHIKEIYPNQYEYLVLVVNDMRTVLHAFHNEYVLHIGSDSEGLVK